MIQVVNGYLCMTGCDVAAARRGQDPRNPTGDPVKQALIDRAHPAQASRPGRGGAAGPGAAADSASLSATARGILADGIGGRIDIVV